MLEKFSVKKPYTVIVSVILVIILGFVSFNKMTVDLLPDMNFPYAAVMISYPGASPEEIETIVTKPAEQALSTIGNIKRVYSNSEDNSSTVLLEFEQKTNMDSVSLEIRERLDQIKGYWPEGVGNPLIMKMNPNMMPVMVAAVSVKGEEGPKVTSYIEDKIIPAIESVEGVASVTSFGNIKESVRVTLKGDKITNLDENVQRELKDKFSEAESAFNSAKSQAEAGKVKLDSGKKEAADKMSDASLEIEKSDNEIQQGKLEISAKKSELNLAEITLEEKAAELKASKEKLLEQKVSLEQLVSEKENLETEYAVILQRIAVEGETNELKVAKATVGGKLAAIKEADKSLEIINEGLLAIEDGETEIASKKEEIKAGKTAMKTLEEQLNQGAISLAKARSELQSASLEAAVSMSGASAGLLSGEMELKSKEAELKATKEKALKEMDINGIINAEMINAILTAQNFNMPAGYIDEDGIDYLVRVGDKFASVEDIENLILVNMDGISPIYLKDVADVTVVDNSKDIYTKLDSENGILLQIQKQTGYSTGDVTHKVNERFEKLKEADESFKVVQLMDQGDYIDMVVGAVLKNLLMGAVLALLILFLFLKDIRPTFIVACSIPISILTAIVLMFFTGVTINIISLSGLALGVGMLVDNSIVVIENIYRLRKEEGYSVKEAAVEGAKEVSGAIMASTLTTVCVFLPIVFTEGIARQLFVDMGLTIAYSLLASLIVALSLVPMLSAGLLRNTTEKELPLFTKIQNCYGKVLDKALDHKKLVVILALVLFIVSTGLELTNGTAFMPESKSTQAGVTVSAADGTTMEEMSAKADAFTKELEKIDGIEHIGGMMMGSGFGGTGKTDTENVQVYLLLDEHRKISDKKMEDAIEKAAKKEGLEAKISLSMMDMGAIGQKGITVQIKGNDLDKLTAYAKEVADVIKDVDGIKNVSDGMEKTTSEVRVVVDKQKASENNLTVAEVYSGLSKKLKQQPSATRLDTIDGSYDIVVSDSRSTALTKESLKEVTIDANSPDGSKKKVPLKDISEFKEGTGLQTINREAGERFINVTAEIDNEHNIGLVSHEVEKKLDTIDFDEGYKALMKGEDEAINSTLTELFKMLGLAVLFMYLIMVAQFQSLKSPFIVMFTVPLAFTGGLLGLFVSGKPLSVIAMIGFVVLSGIIVNNGIVFIDYSNQLIMERGIEAKEALVIAGKTRLRPIIMTALTTILGLVTLAAGIGTGSDMIQPMAIVTIGGLIYGTVLTLFVVPSVYLVFHNKSKKKLLSHAVED